jgi:hypothetical protein
MLQKAEEIVDEELTEYCPSPTLEPSADVVRDDAKASRRA